MVLLWSNPAAYIQQGICFILGWDVHSTSASFPSDTFSCFPALSQGCERGKHLSTSVRHLWIRETQAPTELSCPILGTIWQRYIQSEGPNPTLLKPGTELSSWSLHQSAWSPERSTQNYHVSYAQLCVCRFFFYFIPMADLWKRV